jgi:hypothetical protein
VQTISLARPIRVGEQIQRGDERQNMGEMGAQAATEIIWSCLGATSSNTNLPFPSFSKGVRNVG